MKAVVIEDSRLARQGLIKMLKNHPEISVVGDADHPQSAREVIAKEQPDLLFLDIHMPGESGFELLESLDYTPKIIFTTAYSEYAVKSFDYNTVDYLLKPISNERLALAIDKICGSNIEKEKETKQKTKDLLTLQSRIFVKDGDHCHLIEVQKIRYIESCKNYVRIFFDNKNAFIKKSLNLVEQRLPAGDFFRANRQFIVNMQAISSIDEAIGDGYDLTMADGKSIEVSRRNASRLKEIMSL